MPHTPYMQRALYLAELGLGRVAPNPMVGCVIVHEDKIIGEGFHTQYGKAHAEVEAINRVKDKSLLSKSTLYVTLEPCNHQGKTPPCTELILKHQIPRVVVATQDPNPLVAGKGIQMIKEKGVEVIMGVLEKEAQFLNRRFFTFHQKHRPYIILKWAQTQNGYINQIENNIPKPLEISNLFSLTRSHQFRTQEQAILVGENTVKTDNPQLTARLWSGANPLRVILAHDPHSVESSNIMQDEFESLFFHTKPYAQKTENTSKKFVQLTSSSHLPEFLQVLHQKNIQSVLVEGGAKTLQLFINQGLWDEARVFHSSTEFSNGGSRAPELLLKPQHQEQLDTDILYTYYKTCDLPLVNL